MPSLIPKMGAESWVKLLTTVGLPGALLCYLIYSFTEEVKVDVKDIKTNLGVHLLQSQIPQSSTIEIQNYLRRICVNTAKNLNERNSCLQ